MKLNKVLQGTLVVAAAAATWAGAGAMDAAAATAAKVEADSTLKTPRVEIDLDAQKLSVTPGEAKEVMYSVATKVAKSGKATLKMAAWDIYDAGSSAVDIDLSKLVNTKDNYIAVKTEQSTQPVIIKIPAAAKTTVAAYNAATDVMEVKAGTKGSNAAAVERFEYRTSYGNWALSKALDAGKTQPGATDNDKKMSFANYQEQGATLYVRVPGGKVSSSGSLVTQVDDAAGEDLFEAVSNPQDADKFTKVYKTVGSLPSKEVKVTVAKKANGPKVSASYSKGKVTLPKDTQYRLLKYQNSAWDFVKDSSSIKITDVSAKTTLSVADILKSGDTSYSEGVIEVRVAANEGKKKAASKWTRVELTNPVAFDDKQLTVADSKYSSVVSSAKGEYRNTLDESTKTAIRDLAKVETTTGIDAVTAGSNGGVVKYGNAGIRVMKITDGDSSSPVDLVTFEYGGVKQPATDKKGDKVTGNLVITNKTGNMAFEVVVLEKGDVVDFSNVTAKKLAAKKDGKLTIKGAKEGWYVYMRQAGVDKNKEWLGAYKKIGVIDYPKSATYDAVPAATSAP